MNPQAWLGQHNPYLVEAGYGHFLHPDVLPSFIAMQEAAREGGIDLCIVSSFRNFQRQTIIWNRKWRGEATLLDKHGNALDPSTLSNLEKLHAILTWSALPGGSRHHWGTDFDVYDKKAVEQWDGTFSLVDSEYQASGPCFALANWLEKNMQTFGFFRPFAEDKGGIARELWHLSHRAASKAFERNVSMTELTNTISNSDIEGKATIVDNIEEIFYRYILNLGHRWKAQ